LIGRIVSVVCIRRMTSNLPGFKRILTEYKIATAHTDRNLPENK